MPDPLPSTLAELRTAYAWPVADMWGRLATRPGGLTPSEIAARKAVYGENRLPQSPPPGLLQVFVAQFKSPLIYILVFAAVLSALVGDWTDAWFIVAVLLGDALIGTAQEYSAERSASALRDLTTLHATVVRQDAIGEIEAADLVPGDLVILETGFKVPADLRLVETNNLAIDESLLTGESLSVEKHDDAVLALTVPLAERITMAYAGTLVMRGRGRGIVVGTGLSTELGAVSQALTTPTDAAPPLVQRMHGFTLKLGYAVLGLSLALVAIGLARGLPLAEVLLLAVALAVSAIPEGLRAAITITLAVAVRRMSRRRVIVRKLHAVEALGSCTYIASDKTGTLTLNQLTARKLQLPGWPAWEITGAGLDPTGGLPDGIAAPQEIIERVALVSVFCNEGSLDLVDGAWTGRGDAVDVAFLVLGAKLGILRSAPDFACEILQEIPFESRRQFAAVHARCHGAELIGIKGAPEQVLPRCAWMVTEHGQRPLEMAALEASVDALAAEGYKVMALADLPVGECNELTEAALQGMTFLGLVGFLDPVRPEAPEAVVACTTAGITVGMMTGDHPLTARGIAAAVGIPVTAEQVVTGSDLAAVTGDDFDALVASSRVFARVDPAQKLEIVASLQRAGHFVAVTGDGANDAPALRAAQVGVAMGLRGTDLARESAELILTDDRFASIVAGVEEGRVAYANVRKVVHLLVSTGVAEILLVMLAMLTGSPLPLTAVQLLWLNLVAEGIQDVALAFEPAEGDELKRPPRDPAEPIFDTLMIQRLLVTGIVMGLVSFLLFRSLLEAGTSVESARNATLLLMVLFSNVQVGACRSESRSAFTQNPLRNPLLLWGTVGATLVHVVAMYHPLLQGVLHLEPISGPMWGMLLLLSLLVMVASEVHKLWRRIRIPRRGTSAA